MERLKIQKAIQTPINSSEEKESQVSGQAIVLNTPDAANDIFANDLKINLENDIDIYFNHNYDIILASTRNNTADIEIKENGLFFKADILHDDKILKKVKDGLIWGVSCGFYVDNYETNDNGGYVFKEVTVFEVSLTHMPAHSGTQVKNKLKEEIKKEPKGLSNDTFLKIFI